MPPEARESSARRPIVRVGGDLALAVGRASRRTPRARDRPSSTPPLRVQRGLPRRRGGVPAASPAPGGGEAGEGGSSGRAAETPPRIGNRRFGANGHISQGRRVSAASRCQERTPRPRPRKARGGGRSTPLGVRVDAEAAPRGGVLAHEHATPAPPIRPRGLERPQHHPRPAGKTPPSNRTRIYGTPMGRSGCPRHPGELEGSRRRDAVARVGRTPGARPARVIARPMEAGGLTVRRRRSRFVGRNARRRCASPRSP